jgi:hypothetical protein
MPVPTPSRAADLRRLPADAFIVYGAGDPSVVIYDRDEVVRTVAAITRQPAQVIADAVDLGPTGNPDGALRVTAAAGGRDAEVIFPRVDAPRSHAEQARTGRYAVTDGSTGSYAYRTDLRAEADEVAASTRGRVIDTLPADRPRLDTALAPRYVDGDLTRIGALESADYRIDRVPLAAGSYAGGGLWQAVRTTGPRSSAGGTVGNLGTVDSLDVAVHVVARDAGAYADLWQAAHPTTVKIDGYTYVRADLDADHAPVDADVYVWLGYLHGADAPADPIARAIFRGDLGTTGAMFAQIDTGERVPDPVNPHDDEHVCAWVIGTSPAGVQADPGTAAILDAAVRDVADAADRFAAADARMGDPYP